MEKVAKTLRKKLIGSGLTIKEFTYLSDHVLMSKKIDKSSKLVYWYLATQDEGDYLTADSIGERLGLCSLTVRRSLQKLDRFYLITRARSNKGTRFTFLAPQPWLLV